MQSVPRQRLDIHGVPLDILQDGSGPTLLVLHDGRDPSRWHDYLARLARHCRVVAPLHPGFGFSPRPGAVETVDDLAFLYLDLVDDRRWRGVHLVGAGLGGWIAAEMAVRCVHPFASLTLIGAVGIRISPPDVRDILDVYAMGEADRFAALFHDPEAGRRILGSLREMDEATLRETLANEEAETLYTWKPFMHDPALLKRLHRVRVPTLVLWGAHDRVASTDYGRAYAAAIPGARFATIAGAGHLAHLERAEAVAEAIAGFVGELR